jgi:hypothetical protein
MLQQRAGGQFGGVRGDDPRQLAQAVARYRQQDEGGLASLFGGGGGGEGGGMGDLLSNPLAKAALGGVAAVAMKKMLDRR